MPIRNMVNSVSMDESSWAIANRLSILRGVSRSKAISVILQDKARASHDKALQKLVQIGEEKVSFKEI